MFKNFLFLLLLIAVAHFASIRKTNQRLERARGNLKVLNAAMKNNASDQTISSSNSLKQSNNLNFLNKLKLNANKKLEQIFPSTFNINSASLVFFNRSSLDKRNLIKATMSCPSTSGALRGFTLVKNPNYSASRYGFEVFNYRFECSSNASDFTDKTFPTISGTSSTKTNVDVCRTDGPGHILLPAGNTCACPDGYVIKSLSFNAQSLPNYVGVSCTCAKVKASVTLTCVSKQTVRMSLDSMNGNIGSTLYDFVKAIPVISNNVASLKSVTFTLTSSSSIITSQYTAKAVFYDYTFCYSTADSSAVVSGPTNIDTVGVTDDDKFFIVYYHNTYRNQLATQTTAHGTKLPLAKNMRQMYWNDEIAKKAQEHANKCKFEHSTREFRDTAKFGLLGENLGIYSSTSGAIKNWAGIIKMLNDEINNYVTIQADPNNFQDSPQADLVVGHFTQVNWAKSYLVGCGYSVYIENGMTKSLYVCQYAPSGNYLGMPFYETIASKAEMACPSGTSASNTQMTGLCCLPNMCSINQYIWNNYP